jgi:tetratricopeptide (TPR) repeat protein
MTGAIIRRVAVCAVVVGMTLIPQIASAQSGAVRGKVVDAQGNPVDGAQIEIASLDKGGKPLVVKTKKDGTYMQVGLSPGGYKMTASKGDLSSSMDNVRVGLDMKELNFTLAPAAKGGGNKPNPKLVAAQKAFDEAVQLSNADDLTKYDDAVAKFGEAAAAMAPAPCGECYSNIGTVQLKQAAKLQGDDQKKKLDEAEASFKKAIEAKPDLADAYNGLANLYNAEKKFDQAAEASKKAMELLSAAPAGAAGGAPGAAPAPPSTSAVYNQGVIFWNAGKIPEATAQFEQAVKADPNNADAHYWLGMARMNAGKMQEGVSEFETYLKLMPDCAPVIKGDTSNSALAEKCKNAVQADQAVKALKK